MTLDEAILHAREVAVRNRKQYKNYPSDRTDIRYQTCEECAEEHEQLAEWLEELKSYRTSVFSGDMTQTMLKEEYCKAIDDFVTKIKKYMETTEQATYIDEINNGNDNYSAMTIYDYVDELANELKAGEQNE